MLSPRQQHCLNGIGIQQWQKRPTAQSVVVGQLSPVDTELETAPAITSKPASIETFELDNWTQTLASINSCKNCELSASCKQKVPGKGFQQADLMIIGEAPGHDEDLQGIPFVGRAGQLLDKMLAAINLDLDSVYITNILKCRPPNNRDPKLDEVQACSPFLQAQIKLLQPKVILAVGRISAQNLLKEQSPLGQLRTAQHRLPETDIPLLVTYHPAYLLRNPVQKAKVWQDLKALHKILQHAAD